LIHTVDIEWKFEYLDERGTASIEAIFDSGIFFLEFQILRNSLQR